jgi:hypothetical protein
MAPPRTNRRRISCAAAALALAVAAGMALTTETQARRASPLDELRSSLNELFSPPRRARRAKPRQAQSIDSTRQRGSETRDESPSPARSIRPERPDEKPRAAPRTGDSQPQADRTSARQAPIPPPRPRPPEAPARQQTARLPPPKASPEVPARPAPGERRAVPAGPPPQSPKGAEPKSGEPPDSQSPAAQTPETQEPAEPSACQLRLGPEVALIRALPPITGPGECAAEDVVLLEKVMDKEGRAVAIAPPATLRCPMAESVVQWIRDDVAPTARGLGAALKSVTVDTSFECRSRNRVAGAKLSEHGRANAIDLRGFTLANGKSFTFTDVAADKSARERLRQSACARFTTVLGPGSDGYHESHIHLDGIERRGGYRMCQWDVRDETAIAMPLPPERPASAPPRAAQAAKSGDRR